MALHATVFFITTTVRTSQFQDRALNGNGRRTHGIKRIPFVLNASSCGLPTFLDTVKLAREKESTLKVGGPLEQGSVDSW
jgi:hypothetical protein